MSFSSKPLKNFGRFCQSPGWCQKTPGASAGKRHGQYGSNLIRCLYIQSTLGPLGKLGPWELEIKKFKFKIFLRRKHLSCPHCRMLQKCCWSATEIQQNCCRGADDYEGSILEMWCTKFKVSGSNSMALRQLEVNLLELVPTPLWDVQLY